MPRPISAPILLPSSIASSSVRLLRCSTSISPVGVLVDGQRVDHAHGVALAQPLELGDDLAVEVGVLESQHDQLNRSDRHRLRSLEWGSTQPPSIHGRARIVQFGRFGVSARRLTLGRCGGGRAHELARYDFDRRLGRAADELGGLEDPYRTLAARSPRARPACARSCATSFGSTPLRYMRPLASATRAGVVLDDDHERGRAQRHPAAQPQHHGRTVAPAGRATGPAACGRRRTAGSRTPPAR